jgi:hypothetical protein
MNEAQKAELKAVLEPIWNQLGWQAQRSPRRGFAQWLSGLRAVPGHLKELYRAWRAMSGAMPEYLKALPEAPPPREKPVALLPMGKPGGAHPPPVDRAPISPP